MSLHKYCLLLLSFALLTAMMKPHEVAANQSDKQTEKSQVSKKKKRETKNGPKVGI